MSKLQSTWDVSSLIILVSFTSLVVLFASGYDWHYDEAWSYQATALSSISELVAYEPFHFANNHIINSLWLKLCQYLDISSLFILRLISVVSSVIFGVYTLKLLGKIGVSSLYSIVVFLGPYLLFFAQARGYALALALLSIALYHLYCSINQGQYTTTQISIISLLLSFSSIANFSFVFFNTAVLGVLLLWCLRQKRSLLSFTPFLSFIPFLVYIIIQGSSISRLDPSIIGSQQLTDSIKSVIGQIANAKQLGTWSIKNWPILLGAAVFFTSTMLIIRDTVLTSAFSFTRFLLFSIALSFTLVILSHFVAGTAYPLSRATFVYIYVFLLLLVVGLKTDGWPRFRYFSIALVVGIQLISLSFFMYDLSLPSIRIAIREAAKNGFPVHELGINPAIRQIGLEEDYSISQGRDIDQHLSELEGDNKNKVYFIVPAEDVTSVGFPSTNYTVEAQRLKGGFYLFTLNKKMD